MESPEVAPGVVEQLRAQLAVLDDLLDTLDNHTASEIARIRLALQDVRDEVRNAD